jgi:hypothetical protein
MNMPHVSQNRRTARPVARGLTSILAAALISACAGDRSASDSPPPTFQGMPPSGFVDMNEIQVAYIGSAGGGTGTLTFQGQEYPFSVAGLGVGGIGISSIDAKGEVYNLTNVAQFPGAYGEGRYGAVAGQESFGDLWLRNPNNVVMHLRAKREGLMLSVGGDAVVITMNQ